MTTRIKFCNGFYYRDYRDYQYYRYYALDRNRPKAGDSGNVAHEFVMGIPVPCRIARARDYGASV